MAYTLWAVVPFLVERPELNEFGDGRPKRMIDTNRAPTDSLPSETECTLRLY